MLALRPAPLPSRVPAPASFAFDHRHLPLMLRAARRVLRSDDLAWDAVQEALLRAWRSGQGGLDSTPVLRRLAVLSALHLARCQRRRQHHERLACGDEPCCADDPLADIDSREQRQRLRFALAQVTARYREVLELYALEGRDYKEIARALDLPVGTVRSRLFRARRELGERVRAAGG